MFEQTTCVRHDRGAASRRPYMCRCNYTMPQLVIATGNRKKGIEMAEILAATGLEILTLADFPNADAEVEETGQTYADNAEIKVLAAVAATGLPCIADDAGLEIDAMGGEPGLRSRRFLGEETPFPEKM